MKKFLILGFVFCFLIFLASCGGNESGEEAEKGSDTGNTEISDDENTENNDEAAAPDEETTVPDNGNEEPDEAEEVTETPDSDETETPGENVSEDSVTEEEIESNFAGTWAQKIIFRSQSSAAVAKNVPSVTMRYLVVEIRKNEKGEFDFFKKGDRICRTDNRTGDTALTFGVVHFNEPFSKLNTVFFHWKPKDIPGQENVPYLEIGKADGGYTFRLNKDYELRGAKMEDPSTEPMVTDKNDPRIFDHDEDGHPAFTVGFNGFANGDMYYVQRLSHIVTGKLVAEGRIEGNIEWWEDQFSHPDTPNKTLSMQKTTVTNTEKTVFQMIKVDDSMDCETLLERADKGEIFDLADPNTDVPHNKYEE